MKLNRTWMMTALMVGGLCLGTSALQAQPTATVTNTTPPMAPPGGGSVRPRTGVDAIARTLNLTDDQKTKVKPIIDDMQQQIREVRGDATLTVPEKRVKMKEIHDAATAKLKVVLNADQLAKWERMGPGNRRPPMAPPPSTGSAPPSPGTPPPVPPASAPPPTSAPPAGN